MVYESFFESELQRVDSSLGKKRRINRLMMYTGANAICQGKGESLYAEDLLLGAEEESTVEDLLIWHLHDSVSKQMSEEQLGNYMNDLVKKAEKMDQAENVYYILPFLTYYETRWNERKGYGELAALAKSLGKQLQYSNGLFMAAAADCFEQMTEEAYDQREVFAGFAKAGAVQIRKSWRQCEQQWTVNSDSLLIAYGLLKGIRLGILRKEEYGSIAKTILMVNEAEGFVFSQGGFRWRQEHMGLKETMYTMMAYGEYERLRKERPYYGI